GEVEGRALFLHIGGRETNGDVVLPEAVAGVIDRRADAGMRLAYGGIRQADNEKLRQPVLGIDFNDDSDGLDAEGRRTPNFSEHGRARPCGSPTPRLPRSPGRVQD